jgi:hypothetical protein
MQSDPARANDIELQKWGEDSVSCVKFHPSRCCRFAPVPCPNRCFSPSRLSSCAHALLRVCGRRLHILLLSLCV